MSEHPAAADTIACRLERLERQNRRQRWGFLVAGLAAVAALLFDARPAITQPATVSYATVKAQRFLLVNAAGKKRASLFLLPGGQPGLGLYDAAGKMRLMAGSASLESPKRGGSVRTPTSSISAFDKTGDEIGLWP